MQKSTKMLPALGEVGLLLLDLSFKLIAYDRGATAILDCPDQPLPVEILDLIRSRKLSDLSPLKAYFRLGGIEYTCRAHLIESYGGIAEPMVAVQIERLSAATDAIDDLGIKFNLTDREQQALRGISMGLTSKEVAERMSISPNTVKAFLRLIMIKMGVSTRGGIVANLLNRGNLEDVPEYRELETAPPDRSEPRALDASIL